MTRVHYATRRGFLRVGGAVVAGLAVAPVRRFPRVAAQDGAQFAIGDTVEVATDALNLRSGPGLGADVLVVLQTGAVGTVLSDPVAADGYVWYQVDVGQVGWLAGEYVRLYDSGVPPGGLRIRVVDGPLNLRSVPSLGGEIITTVPTGATMRVTQADGGTWADGYHWIAVMVEAQRADRGFIADAFTEPVSS